MARAIAEPRRRRARLTVTVRLPRAAVEAGDAVARVYERLTAPVERALRAADEVARARARVTAPVERTFERLVAPLERALRPMIDRAARLDAIARAYFADPLLNALAILTSRKTSRKARWKIAGELARQPGLIPHRYKSPAARDAIRERTESLGSSAAVRRWLLESIYPDAIIKAAASIDTPQFIRLGREWLGDERARRVPLVPNDLTTGAARRWFKQAIQREAERIIVPGDGRSGGAPAPPESVRALVAYATTLRARLSPREKTILAGWAAGKSAAEIGAELAMSPVAVRVAWHRLKHKLRAAAL